MTDQPPPPPLPPIAPPAPAPRAGQPVRTGMATTSLVSGILGFTICPVVGAIAAVVTGIIALARVSSQPDRHGGRGMAIAGLVCGGVGLLVTPGLLVAILLPSLSRARELSKRLVCASNMKGIGTTMMIYMAEHEGQGAPSIDLLIERGDFLPQQTICLSSGLSVSNYIYIPEAWNVEHSDDVVILYEPKSNHGDEGGNFLFKDGHVSFERMPRYDELVESATPN